MVQVVWFKRDLRTVDHAPLALAAAAGPVLPLYVAEPAYWALPDASARQWSAVRGTLVELSGRLAALGAPLVVRMGEVVAVLARIHAVVGITRLLAHEETGNLWSFARDRAVRRFCREAGIPFLELPQFGAVRGLRDRDRWAAAHRAFLAAPMAAEPERLVPVAGAVPGRVPEAADLGLAPDGCARPQPGTREEGWAQLESFLAGRGHGYRRAMSSPEAGARSCSRLSVPLATGAVSIREVLRRVQGPASVPREAVESLVSRLHWHCHFIQKLEREPALETRSAHALHDAARRPTAADDPVLLAWAEGRTGLPFLDACMRSLVATGWLNFRMRAMVVSVACQQLGLDWQAVGMRLARLFTDYEPGIHWPQVQMQAAQTGINTPRLYNPVKQGLDHDPDGRFVRRWVPELRGIAGAMVHTPWLVDGSKKPLVDPAEGLRAARARLAQVRAQPGYRAIAEQVYARHGSRARRLDDDDPPKTAAKARDGKRQLALGL
jgi:deoxyribodipyrimidine photo-lyase